MKTNPEFKVGDLVDVTDRRDGTIVAKTATITGFETDHDKQYAQLDTGYAVSLRCLTRSKP